jgi:hypothetical protein
MTTTPMTADEKIVASEGLRTVDRKDLYLFVSLARWAITWLDSSTAHEFDFDGRVIARHDVEQLVDRYAELASETGDPS